MRVFLTGHTGFKGAWLSLILTESGHEVVGYSLDPQPGALFEVGDVSERLSGDYRGDVRDSSTLASAIAESSPDLVLHMAAQPLVRESYADPRYTMETNVMGTFAVLEALRSASSVSAAVARAGNVIGGGDVGKDRLMPDLIRGFSAGQQVEIRYPSAVRPWQHVLDCLQGYLDLSTALLDGHITGGEWNFGPGEDSFRTVAEVADLAAQLWGGKATWVDRSGGHPHEAELLALDAAKARTQLSWADRLGYTDAVAWTVDWHKVVLGGQQSRETALAQVREYRLRDAH